MARQIRLDIITPEKVAYSSDVNMVIARTVEGDIGVLPGHAPLIAPLDLWPLRIQTGEEEMRISVCGGFIEVQPEKVTVLGNCAELPEEIDVKRALAAKERAENRLKQREGIDVNRAELALKRALVRLSVSESGKK
jgi:F-type H+-transporting ATPase subunit epsilon